MNSAEKLVKQTIKLLAKTQQLDYEELKSDAKKLVKMARTFDESLLGMMEELMELSNIGAEEELEDINPEVLRIYCRIKEIDDAGSINALRSRVWNHIEEEFELDDSDSEEETDSESETETEPEPEPVPEKAKKVKKKPEQEVVIIG